ncbi:MAG: homoserine kinase [Actinomycetota bacterium]|nr:homoserine kinase [Actinomycetota bacterium]
MTRPPENVWVEVPASSANLGPGFDAVAVAVDLRLTVWAADRADRRVLAEGQGADELPGDDGNLIWRALLAYCAWAGATVPDVSLRARNDIPLERGLGSSAAAAVAGVALGRALTGAGGRDQDLIDLVAELEGHPDNAAAAVLGGLAVCADGRARRLDPSEELRPILCVSAERQPTALARGLLPQAIPLADAAANAARAVVVVAGLCGAMAWDPSAMSDVLHEPARLAAMPGSQALVGELREAGIAACLSGAGPSVLAVVGLRDDAVVEVVRSLAADGFRVRPAGWHRAGASVLRSAALAS